MQPKLLLTQVYGPYGVESPEDDGEGMRMDPYHNQLTREQGVHSVKLSNPTFNLYFMAENIRTPTVVLDFPSWNDFVEELRNGYTHIGITAIIPNLLKAKKMIAYVREHHPQVKVILGGYVSQVPNVRDLTGADEICEGDGIAWLRAHFGEDVDAPVSHPIVKALTHYSAYGFVDRNPTPVTVVPGLGCRNACYFCITSHKWGRRYVPILETGQDVFDFCCAAQKQIATEEISIWDENFLLSAERAKEFLACQEEHQNPFTIVWMWSSAESMRALGVDFLIRLGVRMVWFGAETPKEGEFRKNKGNDPADLVKTLQEAGIAVITSSILFMEHHDEQSLQQEIDWAINLGSDLHQFIQLQPNPGTPLYADYNKRDKILLNSTAEDWKVWHNQGNLTFSHPNFAYTDAPKYTKAAFLKKYRTHGSGIANVIKRHAKGYVTQKRRYEARLKNRESWNQESLCYEKTDGDPRDHFFEKRLERMKLEATNGRRILLAARVFSPNRETRAAVKETEAFADEHFGPLSWKARLASLWLLSTATALEAKIKVRKKLLGKGEPTIQPETVRREYRM